MYNDDDNPFLVNTVNKGRKRVYDEYLYDLDKEYIEIQQRIELIEKYIDGLSLYNTPTPQTTPTKIQYDIRLSDVVISPCSTPTRPYIQIIPKAPKKKNPVFIL